MSRQTLIIGGGHNGLVCAFYLARAGHKVTVLERRGVIGGAAVTEEFHPGFRNSTASYTVSLLNPRIIDDMALHAHGLRIVERPIANFLLTQDGRYLKLGPTLAHSQAQLARFSQADADTLPRYYAMLDQVGDVLRRMAMQTPPNLGDGVAALPRTLLQGNSLRRLGLPQQRDLLDLFTKSAADVLNAWFQSDEIKAVLGFDSIVGNYASPETPGSAYVLLHHTFGGVNGKTGNWGHAMGGMGAITQAMARACTQAGVDIRLNAPVREVLVHNKRAGGVLLESGEEIAAGTIVSNLNPKLLFRHLVPQSELDADFKRRIGGYKNASGTFRMNVALSELPDFTCLPGRSVADHHASGIIIGPTLAYMDRAYQDARAFGWAREPIIEMLIPSTLDDTLAPPGLHVASLFCQHVAPILPDRHWASAREEVADLMIDTVNKYAPNFRAAIVGRLSLSPADLEEKFGLTGGDIMHGNMSLDQLWASRPVLGHASYRSPIRNLYMCGSGTHPGGGVSGVPGYNAAREIIKGRKFFFLERKKQRTFTNWRG